MNGERENMRETQKWNSYEHECTHAPRWVPMCWRCEDISIYTSADLLMPLVKYKCIAVIQGRQSRRNVFKTRNKEEVSLLALPSGACWFFRLMFRGLQDEEEEEVDFKVASRLESVLLKICGSHFVVLYVFLLFLCFQGRNCHLFVQTNIHLFYFRTKWFIKTFYIWKFFDCFLIEAQTVSFCFIWLKPLAHFKFRILMLCIGPGKSWIIACFFSSKHLKDRYDIQFHFCRQSSYLLDWINVKQRNLRGYKWHCSSSYSKFY